MRSTQSLTQWIPAAAWMVVIFIASSDLLSAEHTSPVVGGILRWIWPNISPAGIAAAQLAVRKAAHLAEYAILAVLLARGICRSGVPWRWRCSVIVIIAAGSYAALDELHQFFVSSRTGSIVDVMIDTAGACIGAAAYRSFVRRAARAKSVVTNA